MNTSFSTLLAAVAALFSLTAFGTDKTAQVNAADEKFIKQTWESGRTELKLSELAAQKATRAEVKEFANMLLADHAAANDGLGALATRKGVELSAIIDPKGAAKFRELEKFSGKPFDQEFVTYMRASHRRSVASFEDAAKDATDSDLKAFINKTLPTLRTHLEKAEKLLPTENIPPSPLPPL